MFNILSLGIGLVTFVLTLVAFVPFFGWFNWFLIPLALVGLVIGLLSSRTTGRNVNTVVLLICVVRLSLGGGIF